MIRKFITLFIFLTVIFVSFGHGLSFDKKPGTIKLSNDPELTYINIITVGIATGMVPIPSHGFDRFKGYKKWRKKSGSFILQGMGFVIKDGFIITAAHVINPAYVTLAQSKWSYYRMPSIQVVERVIFINDSPSLKELKRGGVLATIYYLDIENDIAILKFDPNGIFKPSPYGLGRTNYQERGRVFSAIQPGDAVAIVVRDRGEDGELSFRSKIRYGKITSKGIEGVSKKEIPWFNLNDFTMDTKIIVGDSGSAVFAFRNGTPTIIGVVRASNKGGGPFRRRVKKDIRSYATRIDLVKRIVEAE